MTTLRLLVFNFPLLPKSIAHWALFLPDEEGSTDGVLFEVKKRSYSMAHTMFSQRKFNYRTSKSDLRANIAIPEMSIGPVKLNQACHAITQNRPFHLWRRNCQLWVFEVIDYLARSEGFQDGGEILANIMTQGFRPRGYRGSRQRDQT